MILLILEGKSILDRYFYICRSGEKSVIHLEVIVVGEYTQITCFEITKRENCSFMTEYAPTSQSVEFVYQKDSKGNSQLWRKWHQDALTLIGNKCPPDDFIKIMTKKIYGDDKDVVILSRTDPYSAFMRIKELCKGKDFNIKISIENEKKSLLVMVC